MRAFLRTPRRAQARLPGLAERRTRVHGLACLGALRGHAGESGPRSGYPGADGGQLRGAAGALVAGVGLLAAAAATASGAAACDSPRLHFPGTSSSGVHFIADAAEKAMPALVNITGTQPGPFGTMQSAGSGFAIRSDGSFLLAHIKPTYEVFATNAHVVKGMQNMTVTLNDGRQYKARVYAADHLADLAIVEITEPLEGPLPVMEIGDSSKLRPGEFVVALGSPLNLENSVTAGIVSSTARAASELGIAQSRTDYLQTDASINQGNSGGPLINLQGQVIGINTFKVQGGDGIGFAIPIDTAWQVLAQLRDHRKVVRAYLGLRMAALDERLIRHEARNNNHFPNVKAGLLVVKVAPQSPASKAGIRPGDVITHFGGTAVSSVADITAAVGYKIGAPFEVTVARADVGSVHLHITTEALED